MLFFSLILCYLQPIMGRSTMRKKKKHYPGLFDEPTRLDRLTMQKDPLVKLLSFVDFELFRNTLTGVLAKEPKSPGGAPPYDYVMMFKILILQKLYNLSDDKMEFHILDRMSFMRFLGLHLCDSVPDSKTIWLFREKLTIAGAEKELFDRVADILSRRGLTMNSGTMIDASFVEAPRQRNTREENKKIKAGEMPEGWEEKQNMLRQKDLDARWTKKNKETHYGYKDHVKVNAKTKLIEAFEVTDASVHDSQTVDDLTGEADEGRVLHADSAYTGKPIEEILADKKMIPQINEKGYKNKPLTDEQKQSNRIKSKTRARVEHVFGYIENSMNGSFIRSIGILRAKTQIGLMNLTYNLMRCLQLNERLTG